MTEYHLFFNPTKLWCAVGVNLSGGKTRDGGSVVGASVFYKDVAGLEAEGSKQRSASQNSLDKLDQELKVSACTAFAPISETNCLALWSQTDF